MLLSRDRANAVTVVAKHMPGDLDAMYASPIAGANFLPYVNFLLPSPTSRLYNSYLEKIRERT